MGWVRKHPELVILGAFVVVVAAMIVRYQTRDKPPHAPQGLPPVSSPAVAQPSASSSDPGAVAASVAPAASATAPLAIAVSDNPAFDQAGDGTDCSMTYGNGPDGNVVTVVTLGAPGTLVTHVDGPGGQHIHTQAEPKGPVSFTYGFPLDQASVMGAIFYPAAGSREDCAIGPAR